MTHRTYTIDEIAAGIKEHEKDYPEIFEFIDTMAVFHLHGSEEVVYTATYSEAYERHDIDGQIDSDEGDLATIKKHVICDYLQKFSIPKKYYDLADKDKDVSVIVINEDGSSFLSSSHNYPEDKMFDLAEFKNRDYTHLGIVDLKIGQFFNFVYNPGKKEEVEELPVTE